MKELVEPPEQGSALPEGAHKVTSVCPCEASMRPGVKGTVTFWSPFFAACSAPAQPARTIRSASETFLPPDWALLNALRMASSFLRTFASWEGWLTSLSFCGARRMRAPLPE